MPKFLATLSGDTFIEPHEFHSPKGYLLVEKIFELDDQGNVVRQIPRTDMKVAIAQKDLMANPMIKQFLKLYGYTYRQREIVGPIELRTDYSFELWQLEVTCDLFKPKEILEQSYESEGLGQKFKKRVNKDWLIAVNPKFTSDSLSKIAKHTGMSTAAQNMATEQKAAEQDALRTLQAKNPAASSSKPSRRFNLDPRKRKAKSKKDDLPPSYESVARQSKSGTNLDRKS